MPAANRIAFRPRSAHEAEPDLTRLVVTHRAIRHDLDRLVVCLGDGGERSTRRAGAVWRYTAALLAQVRAHNEGEADILWPVAAAAAGQAVDIAPLTDDRHAVAAALTRAGHALAAVRAGSGPPADVQISLRLVHGLLEDHFADEEQQLFPAIRRYLRADAYRWCEKQMRRNSSLPVRRFAAPWLARHAQRGELRQLRATRGWPERILLAGSGPGFARLERHALDASPLTHRSPQRPVPGSNKKRGEEMIEQHTQTGQRPNSMQTDAPRAVRNAAWVMYAGAVASVIRVVADLVTVHATKTAIGHQYPKLSASALSTVTDIAVIGEVAGGLIGAVLFVWIARVCLEGKDWARITATTLCAVGVLGAFLDLGSAIGGGRTTANLIMGPVVAGIGLVSICLLWQRSSNAYFLNSRRPRP
jgi:Hemerythrin HHE cation binding domain